MTASSTDATPAGPDPLNTIRELEQALERQRARAAEGVPARIAEARDEAARLVAHAFQRAEAEAARRVAEILASADLDAVTVRARGRRAADQTAERAERCRAEGSVAVLDAVLDPDRG